MKNLFLFLFLIIILQTSIAQPYSETPYKYKIEAAEESMDANDYYNALEWYKTAYKESKDKDLAVKIANLYYLLRNYKRAAKSFDRVLRKDKDSLYQDHRITYAKSLRGMGDYVEAINQYEQFLNYSSDSVDIGIATRDLNGINEMNSYEDNVDAIIKFADKKINSAFTEYGPAEYADGALYYSSFDRRKVIVLDGSEEDFESKIYTAQKDKEGNYTDPEVLDEHINRPDYNTGNVCFSSDGRRMYFVRTKLDRNNIIESKLYVSYRKDDEWAPPTILPDINGDYFIRHPSVGALYGKEVIFFSANIEGGYGGYDLYYATFDGENNFKTPINLGKSINTSEDELTPFYKDGKLFFSSNGRLGMGELDIYTTSWDGSNWSEVKNMGHGYNSPNDDFFYNLSPNGNNGSLVSNRPNEKKRKLVSETCCDDIYLFSISEIVVDLIALVDGDNGPLAGATAVLIDLSAPESESYNSKQNATNNNFKFLLEGDHNYVLKFKHPDYKTDSILFNTSGIYDDYTVNKYLKLERKPFIPNIETIKINEPIRLSNIYYDFNDATILRDAEKDLNALVALMNEYKDIVIELGSHTDAQGLDPYNKNLSQRRAESAKQYMLRKGIAGNRILPKGYGETVIINRCVNGVKCSDDEHRENRRTEFKIIKGPETIEITKKVVTNKPPEIDSTSKNSDPTPLEDGKKMDDKIEDTEKKVNSTSEPKAEENKPKTTKKKRKIRKKRKRRKVNNKFKKAKKKSGKQSFSFDSFPIIQFDNPVQELGNIKNGETISLSFPFTNTGSTELIIDLVSTCKCTELEWPKTPIAPGEKGIITGTFHSKGLNGNIEKTIDIISNTNPIVVEAKFNVFIGD